MILFNCHMLLSGSSSEYRDELCVSAALLYKATQKPGYLSDAISVYNSYSPSRWAYDWDDKSVLCDVRLILLFIKKQKYVIRLNAFYLIIYSF